MKRICLVLFLCGVFLLTLLLAAPASGSQDLPAVVEDIVRNRDFFTQPWVLWRYEDCFINSAKRLDGNRIGVVLIAPSGFEHSLVYDVETIKAVYEDMRIPEKSEREAIRQESIGVADALKLARFYVSHAEKAK